MAVRRPYRRRGFLEDGTELVIEQLTGRDCPAEFMRIDNALITEGGYVLRSELLNFEQEEGWLRERSRAKRLGTEILLKAYANGRLVGYCLASRDPSTETCDADLGIVVEKTWRRHGIGRILLTEAIDLAERIWQARRISLSVVRDNRNAIRLYESLGFKQAAAPSRVCRNDGMPLELLAMVLDRDKTGSTASQERSRMPA